MNHVSIFRNANFVKNNLHQYVAKMELFLKINVYHIAMEYK